MKGSNSVIRKRICKNIRIARRSKGFTQVAFADSLGIKRSTYAEWENNFIPSVEAMIKISALTEVEFQRLVYEDLDKHDIKICKKMRSTTDCVPLNTI